ncbi:hypothetical protein BGZ89_010615 [Linnemannia elongata]|nr:hypothetical protein BGZ89_010615 [Linnemannia elongata]
MTHERKHTGERPYKCPHPDCDKTFTQLGNLKTHERIHDEVKPFMCRLPGCGKTFSQLGNLKRRPIQPQQSEEERLLRKIRAMIHHQQRVRELEDGSEVSDEMDE